MRVPMLLYGITEADAIIDAEALRSGVCEAAVESVAESGVRCFYSRVEKFVADGKSFRANALRFHNVLRTIMEHATIVPFRFPTLLETQEEIREFVGSHAAAYAEDLRRLRGQVQMEVRIKLQGVSAEPQSGREYMDSRLAESRALTAHAGAVFEAARELITDWHVHEEAHGVHCYALVPREQVAAFEERVRAPSPVEGASILVSGPWPPSEFLHVRNS